MQQGKKNITRALQETTKSNLTCLNLINTLYKKNIAHAFLTRGPRNPKGPRRRSMDFITNNKP